MLDADRRRGSSGTEAAATLAIDVLNFLAAEPERVARFLSLSGLEAHELRAAASEPSFLPAVLDFLMGDEAMLLDFAAERSIAPERIAQARRALAGRARQAE